MDKLGFIKGQMNAEVIRGFLEAQGLKASCAPWGGFMDYYGRDQAQVIYVEHGKVLEALGMLKEAGIYIEKEQ